MSLILEALKKSEAKRRLGEAPDLETPFAAQRRRRSPLPLIVVAIAIAAGTGWWLLRTPAVPAGAVSAPTPVKEKPMAAVPPAAPAAVKPPAANPPATAPVPPPAAPIGTTQPAADSTNVAQWVPVGQGSLRTVGVNRKRAAGANPGDTASVPAAMPTPKPRAMVTSAPPNTAAAVTPPPGVKKPEPAPEPAPVAAAKKPEPLVATLPPGVKKPEPLPETALATGMKKPEPATPAAAVASHSGEPAYYELPFSVRKDLPSLKLSMHVYAPEPAQRFIILNDSRMVEGNSQDDLALREIRPDGAVFEFKGQRFFYPRDGL